MLRLPSLRSLMGCKAVSGHLIPWKRGGPEWRRREARDPNVVAFVGPDPHTLAQMREYLAAAATPRRLDGYPDVAAALAGISRRPPVAVLVDLGMPGGYGPSALHRLRCRFPRLPFVALAPAKDTDAVLLALMAGAVGCVVQPAAAEDLIRAVNDAVHGDHPLCRRARAMLVGFLSSSAVPVASQPRLSPREHQVLIALLHDQTAQEVADALRISIRTAQNHIARLYRKIGAHSRHELVRKLLRRP